MKEVFMPLKDCLPIEPPIWFGKSQIQKYVDLLRLEGPLPIIVGIPYGNKVILPDGHNRTILNALCEEENQWIRILETEEDRINYGTGGFLSWQTLEDAKEEYERTIKRDMRDWGIQTIYDYQILKNLKYKKEIFRRLEKLKWKKYMLQ
jgi:hypothetical protein